MNRLCVIVPESEYLFNPWTIEPLGAVYVATAAQPYVDEATVRVWNHEPIPVAEWYGITVVTPHYEQVRRIIAELRAKTPDAKIILGGAHCTFLPGETMQDLRPDFLVAGEGEEAIVAILTGNYAGISGIYTPQNGFGRTNEPILAALPIPDHSLLLHTYYPNPAFADVPGGAIMASRGCPYGCSYCGASVGQRVRWRNPEQVAEEMEMYHQWRFEDDDLFGDHYWFRAFAKTVPPDREWRCSVRAKSITPEILALAKEIGCRQIGIGVETASKELLKRHCPSKSVEANTRGVQMVKDAGILVTAFLIAGLPGETEETLQETIDWIQTIRPDKFTVSACTPYPGSKLWRNRNYYGIFNMDPSFAHFQQLGHEDDDVAFVFDTDAADRKKLTEMWHRLRKVAQYGITPKA